MRFQTTKRIPGQDPDLVLGTLEGCLRSVSNEIVREGRRITFFGLGPSPRAVNRRDTTVIDVHAVDGITTIDADVRFQASAFLGRASQDAVVQAKLDRVFEEMRMRLGLEPWLAQSREEPAESAPAVGTEVLSEALPEVETRHLSMAQAEATQALPDTVVAGSPVTSSEGSEDAVIELLASAAAVSESIEEPEVLVGSERDLQAEVLKTEPTVVEPVLVGSAVGSGGPEERRKQSEPRTITAEVVPTVVSKPKPYPSASKRGLLMLPEAPFEEPVADASIPAPRLPEFAAGCRRRGEEFQVAEGERVGGRDRCPCAGSCGVALSSKSSLRERSPAASGTSGSCSCCSWASKSCAGDAGSPEGVAGIRPGSGGDGDRMGDGHAFARCRCAGGVLCQSSRTVFSTPQRQPGTDPGRQAGSDRPAKRYMDGEAGAGEGDFCERYDSEGTGDQTLHGSRGRQGRLRMVCPFAAAAPSG